MPDWRFNYRSRNVPVLDLVVQAEGHPAIQLTGIVDSGATHTMLSIETAEALGLRRTDLIKSPPATIADDTKVPSWTTEVAIRAQVQARLPDEGPPEPWGPIFDLYPRFMKSGSPLLGQEDFCASFKVNLERFLLPAYFVLEYWAGMSEGSPRAGGTGT
jgi:hypothetical protein